MTSSGDDSHWITTLDLGIRACHDLGVEFLATVAGSGPTGQSSVTCGVDDGSLQSKFFLNPFDKAAGQCAGIDWVVIAILVIIAHSISWIPRWLVWEPLGDFRMVGHKSWDATKRRLYSQTCAQAQSFAWSSYFAGRILFSKDWLLQRSAWIERSAFIDADFKFYYLLYTARFISDMISLFFEIRKTEAFTASLLHHLVTIGLVLGSAWVGHIRYGGVIMSFFDWADLPLMVAKVFKYMSQSESDVFQWIANRFFEFFAVCFFLTRNCIYNYVVYAAWADLNNDWVNRGCQYLLILLVLLQTYWLVLIIRVAVIRAENDGNADDIREFDEPPTKKKKKTI